MSLSPTSQFKRDLQNKGETTSPHQQEIWPKVPFREEKEMNYECREKGEEKEEEKEKDTKSFYLRW